MAETRLELTQFFNETTLARGEQYLQGNHLIEWAGLEGFYEAKARGSRGEIYNVKLLLQDSDIVVASCECPSRRPCKHIAALALLACRSRKNGSFYVSSDPV